LRYSIDTSALLDGWVRYYPPDVFPRLWEELDDLIDRGDLRATDEVFEELRRKDDAVAAWASDRNGLFVALDEKIQVAVAEVLADYPKLIDTRANRSAADPFVIALAKVHGCTVVTGEQATGSLQRPNIPDVCGALGLDCVTLLQLLRAEGLRF